MSAGSGEGENVYFMDPESGSEMARLIGQDQVVTQAMGGPFAERADMTGIQRVLDLACGPGGWVLNVAATYPGMQVVGLDISRMMIEYAQAQAHVRRLQNVRFQIRDILQPLDFPDASFDLINARFILFIPPAQWPVLLRECYRLLRPGGTMRLIETELPITTSPTLQKLFGRWSHKLKESGRSFSADGGLAGITPMLGKLLRDAGYKRVQLNAYPIEWSYGTEAYQAFYDDYMIALKLGQASMIRLKVATQEELDALYDQILQEMRSEDFCALLVLLKAWGEKPV